MSGPTPNDHIAQLGSLLAAAGPLKLKAQIPLNFAAEKAPAPEILNEQQKPSTQSTSHLSFFQSNPKPETSTSSQTPKTDRPKHLSAQPNSGHTKSTAWAAMARGMNSGLLAVAPKLPADELAALNYQEVKPSGSSSAKQATASINIEEELTDICSIPSSTTNAIPQSSTREDSGPQNLGLTASSSLKPALKPENPPIISAFQTEDEEAMNNYWTQTAPTNIEDFFPEEARSPPRPRPAQKPKISQSSKSAMLASEGFPVRPPTGWEGGYNPYYVFSNPEYSCLTDTLTKKHLEEVAFQEFHIDAVINGTDSGSSPSEEQRKCSTSIKMDKELLQEARLLKFPSLEVPFPYSPYEQQFDYMEKLIECLDHGDNGLFESLPSTGKTLALITTSLAWLRDRQLKGKHLNTKIFLAVRSPEACDEAVKLLAKTCFRPRYAILGKREDYCVNREVLNFHSHDKNGSCYRLVKDGNCRHFENLKDPVKKEQTAKLVFEGGTPLDMNSLKTAATKEEFCPYYFSRRSVATADLVILTQNNLANPYLRNTMRPYLTNSVLLFDESHTLASKCEESESWRMSGRDIDISLMELKKVQNSCNANEKTDPRAGNLSKITESIMTSMKCLKTGLEKRISGSMCDVYFKEKDLFDLVGECFVRNRIDYYMMTEQQKNSHQRLLKEMLSQSQSIGLVLDYINSEKPLATAQGPLIRWALFIDQLYRLVYIKEQVQTSVLVPPTNLTIPHPANLLQHYRLVIEYRKKAAWREAQPQTPKHFNYGYPPDQTHNVVADVHCMSAHFATHDLYLGCAAHSIILSSFSLTLPDPSPFSLDLMLPFPKTFLSRNHILANEQFLSTQLSYFAPGSKIKLDFATRNNSDLLNTLGEFIAGLLPQTPQGVVIFFTSYIVLHGFWDSWRDKGLLDRMEKHKKVFKENSYVASVKPEIKKYKSLCCVGGKGAVFLTVYNGKVNDELEFGDGSTKLVISIGVPFPNLKMSSVEEKTNFLTLLTTNGPELAIPNRKSAVGAANAKPNPEEGTESAAPIVAGTSRVPIIRGDGWFNRTTAKNITNSLLPCISGRFNHLAMIFLDERFEWQKVKSVVHPWLTSRTKPMADFKSVTEAVTRFFEQTPKFIRTAQEKERAMYEGPGEVELARLGEIVRGVEDQGGYVDKTFASKARKAGNSGGLGFGTTQGGTPYGGHTSYMDISRQNQAALRRMKNDKERSRAEMMGDSDDEEDDIADNNQEKRPRKKRERVFDIAKMMAIESTPVHDIVKGSAVGRSEDQLQKTLFLMQGNRLRAAAESRPDSIIDSPLVIMLPKESNLPLEEEGIDGILAKEFRKRLAKKRRDKVSYHKRKEQKVQSDGDPSNPSPTGPPTLEILNDSVSEAELQHSSKQEFSVESLNSSSRQTTRVKLNNPNVLGVAEQLNSEPGEVIPVQGVSDDDSGEEEDDDEPEQLKRLKMRSGGLARLGGG